METIYFQTKSKNQIRIPAFLKCLFFFSPLIFLLLIPSMLPAAQVSLAWNPNTETDLAGYKIYIGYAPRTYSWIVDAGNQTQGVVNNLEDSTTYYLTLTATNNQGLESGFSNEVIYTTPAASQFTLTVSRSGTGSGTVTNSPAGTSFASGTTVTLTAAAAAGSTFGGWGGACSGTANTCTVTMSANRSVTATFTLKSYTITASAGANGSISPSGATTVAHGGSQTYTITPNSGYQISSVLVDGASVGAVGSYTFSSVTAAHTISAGFTATPVTSYTLTVTKSGTGSGTVTNSPAGTSFASGTTVTLTAAADAGSTFGGWGGACSGTASTCTVTMSANRSVTATFTLKSYTITASAGANGSISPSGATTVAHGGSQTYTITPNSGYQISSVLVDGTSVGAVGSYTFSSVTAAHTISAGFTATPVTSYTLTVTKSGTGSGTVTNSPAGTSFASGTTVTLTAAAADGSTFGGWGGACSGTANTCTVAMSANRSVTATFTLKSYTITASAGANGSISPSGATTVAHGGSQTYTITPNSGYQISSVLVDGTSVGAVGSYTFSSVTAAHTISAGFTATPVTSYTLTVTKSGTGSGTVTNSPAGTSFASGTPVTLTAAAAAGSTFGGWGGACSGTANTCTVTMSANRSVSAAFTLKTETYTITASAGAHGSISPNGVTTVADGGSQIYTITPTTGYQVEAVTVDGSSVGPVSSYAFSNVIGNHVISATFVKAVNSFFSRSLELKLKGSGKGVITVSPSGTVFRWGTKVTLKATPDKGFTFAGWSGSCSGQNPTCTLTMYSNQSVTATFGTGGSLDYKVFLPMVRH